MKRTDAEKIEMINAVADKEIEDSKHFLNDVGFTQEWYDTRLRFIEETKQLFIERYTGEYGKVNRLMKNTLHSNFVKEVDFHMNFYYLHTKPFEEATKRKGW